MHMSQLSPPSTVVNGGGAISAAKLKKHAALAAKAAANLSWHARILQPLRHVNESKIAVGFIMILMNIGMKYVDFGFSKTQEQALRNGIAREMIIFAVCFMGTRDIFLSILLTGSFMIMADVLFNDNSAYCVVPNYMQRMRLKVEKNLDNGPVTHEEEKRARDILEKAERMRQNTVQSNMQTYLADHV
jgi:hypothetical protein